MIEVEHYTCGTCNEPVYTYWSKGGLEEGDYVLMGEVFFHKGRCLTEYLEEINLAIQAQEKERK